MLRHSGIANNITVDSDSNSAPGFPVVLTLDVGGVSGLLAVQDVPAFLQGLAIGWMDDEGNEGSFHFEIASGWVRFHSEGVEINLWLPSELNVELQRLLNAQLRQHACPPSPHAA